MDKQNRTLSRPFMYWDGDPAMPCFVSPFAPDDVFVVAPEIYADLTVRYFVSSLPRVTRHVISAQASTWTLAAALNLAAAYRPGGTGQ